MLRYEVRTYEVDIYWLIVRKIYTCEKELVSKFYKRNINFSNINDGEQIF